ncbi:hypothetical protein CgunFtcFv8_021283 [Champsocephalus gunnari]|uniref:Uncharacterized protein n=1 Tax=Champsocephalus gunnari TaxID=52237 RepID=A0AAN8I1E3_CHAGU|nr:hypothetical protein CgunFtcFv8_021283 [Champsocephalus gunnari]
MPQSGLQQDPTLRHIAALCSRAQQAAREQRGVSLVQSHTLPASSIADRHPHQMPGVPWAQRHHCEGRASAGK